VTVLPEVELEAVTVLGGVGTVRAPVLVHVRVGLEMGVEHGLVDASVGTLGTDEGFGTKMVPEMILQVVLVLCDEGTLWAVEHLLRTDVGLGVSPKFTLCD
jgi:hypothetical protein